MSLSLLSVMHVNVNCSDLERSLVFYRDRVGLVPQSHTNPMPQDGTGFGLPGRVIWDANLLHDDRGFASPAVDLLEWKEPPAIGEPARAANQLGFVRLCLAHPDLDALHASWVIHDAFQVVGNRFQLVVGLMRHGHPRDAPVRTDVQRGQDVLQEPVASQRKGGVHTFVGGLRAHPAGDQVGRFSDLLLVGLFRYRHDLGKFSRPQACVQRFYRMQVVGNRPIEYLPGLGPGNLFRRPARTFPFLNTPMAPPGGANATQGRYLSGV